MQHVVVQLPSAPWLARVAHTVVAAWAASVDLTLDEIDEAGLLLEDMLTALLEVSDGPVTMRLSSTSLIVELSAPLRRCRRRHQRTRRAPFVATRSR